ncbi:MAG: hypothetical protein NTU53_24525 [Planctomycetota bacterium]|nr:hypothetical protein [Planctomycetota bacterium]
MLSISLSDGYELPALLADTVHVGGWSGGGSLNGSYFAPTADFFVALVALIREKRPQWSKLRYWAPIEQPESQIIGQDTGPSRPCDTSRNDAIPVQIGLSAAVDGI